MKKHVRGRAHPASAQAGRDLADQILKVQQQLTFLDKKMDTLIGQSSRPFQHSDHPHHQGRRMPDNGYRERVMHKAICADCKKGCEVPFRPTGDRPVYCRDCFAKRKHGSAFMKEKPETAPVERKKPAIHRKKVIRKK